MIQVDGEDVHVVHFSSPMSDHLKAFPDNLLHVIANPTLFCLSCSAFTSKMLRDPDNNLPGEIGLMFDVANHPSDVFRNSECCDHGAGNQIRAVCQIDDGKRRVDDGDPCIPKDSYVTLDNIRKSLVVLPNRSHNEWVIKPPHKVIGIFLSNNYPCAKVAPGDGNNDGAIVEIDRCFSLEEIRALFPELKIKMRNWDKRMIDV